MKFSELTVQNCLMRKEFNTETDDGNKLHAVPKRPHKVGQRHEQEEAAFAKPKQLKTSQ